MRVTQTQTSVVDGLDLREELGRLARLRAFRHPQLGTQFLLEDPPTLQVTRYDRHVRNFGNAAQGRKIRINVGTNVDRYLAQETLIHELTHIYWQRLDPLDRVAHSEPFWRKLDEAFQEAYGSLRVAPRRNRFAGRYAAALRLQTVDRAAESFVEDLGAFLETEPPLLDPGYVDPTDPARVELVRRETALVMGLLTDDGYERPLVIPQERLPEPLKSLTREPANVEFGGRARVTWPRPDPPVLTVPTSVGRTSQERDAQVLGLVQDYPGRDREMLDYRYERRYGERYPGASVYNSLWRLRRDGRVYRSGRRWYSNV